MSVPGYDAEKCRKRNHVAARRELVSALPMRLMASAPAPVAQPRMVTAWGTLPATNAEAVERINEIRLQADPEAAPLTEEDVYVHYAEAANSNFVRKYYMFFGSSSLRNFAADAVRGVAFMNSHRTGSVSTPSEQPYGRTFAGRYEKYRGDDGKAHERSVLGFYMMRGVRPTGDSGPSTDDLHRMIEGGTTFDVSPGWPSDVGYMTCDVCQNDIKDEACTHAPGTHRNMSPDQVQAQLARGVQEGRASITHHDAHLSELSGVYDGAIPGAGYRKTLALARQRKLTLRELAQAREAYMMVAAEGDFGMDTDIIEEASESIAQKVVRLLKGGTARQDTPTTTPDDEEDEADEVEAPVTTTTSPASTEDDGDPNDEAPASAHATPPSYAAMQARIAELEAREREREVAQDLAAAQSLTERLVLASKLLPASAESVQNLYVALATDDRRMPLDAGSRVSLFTAMLEGNNAHALTTEAVQERVNATASAVLFNKAETTHDAAGKPVTPERRNELLAKTPEGKAALKKMEVVAAPSSGHNGRH